MHFLTKTFGRLHGKGSHSIKLNPKDKRIEKWFYNLHVPKNATMRYLKNFSFDNNL